MTTQRFFLPPESIDIAGGQVEITERSTLSQMRSVLRLKSGESILVLNGSGQLLTCELNEIAADRIEARIVNISQASGDPPIFITLAMPLLKGDRFEWALQKLTELGVGRVLPFVSDRSVIKLDLEGSQDARLNSKLKRWQTIMKEAAEQCERACVPRLELPNTLQSALQSIAASGKSKDISLICAERRQTERLSTVLKTFQAARHDVALIVGPEGGFTPAETEFAVTSGFQAVSLGPRILRSETAAVYSVSQVVALLADG